jgi:ankyrin repeat protein
VRLLLSRNAGEAYVNTPEANRRVITGAINSEAKPTPLQWASYKGHLQIFWLLLKAGMKWEDVDSFGNNSVNLAAAGGNIKVFESLLQLGVSLTIKNSRGHSCADLSTVT